MMAKKAETKTGMMGGLAATEGAGLDALGKMIRPQMAMAQAVLDYNIETLDFLKARFERDREMLGELAKTVDPMQAASLWSEFWQRTASDYAMESAKLSTSLQTITQQAVQTASEESEALAGAFAQKG
jgi:hypothetical protein